MGRENEKSGKNRKRAVDKIRKTPEGNLGAFYLMGFMLPAN